MLDFLDRTERNWSFLSDLLDLLFVYGVLNFPFGFCFRKEGGSSSTLGFFDVLGFLLGLFVGLSRGGD